MLGFNAIGVQPIGYVGSATATPAASAAGAVLVALATIAAGSTTSTAAGTAPGVSLTSTASISAGTATGTASSAAPGASLHGTSSISAGAASSSTSQAGSTGTITVPASRTARFAGRTRVAVFNSDSPVSVAKVLADELYYVGDVSKDLTDGGTTADSVVILSAGVAVLQGPVIQGNLIVVKLGGFDTTPAAANFCTFRVTCVNGEQFDRTIQFTAIDDRLWVFGKDPDDKRYFAFDFGADSALGASALASVQTPVVADVSSLAAPTIQGNLAIVKVGGLSLADGAANSCSLTALLANGEKVVRTIYFTRKDH